MCLDDFMHAYDSDHESELLVFDPAREKILESPVMYFMAIFNSL